MARLLSCCLLTADEVKELQPAFSYNVFRERNQWMVKHVGRIIAVYNGKRGGTRNTLAYARKQKLQICLING